MDLYIDEKGNGHKKPEQVIPEKRISVYVLIESNDGKILMVQSAQSHQWELPGGGIEKGESVQEGVIRECYEETGYEVEVEKSPILSGEQNFYSNTLKKFFRSMVSVYVGKLTSDVQNKEMINSVEKDEIENVNWFKPEEFDALQMHPLTKGAIKIFLKAQK